MDRSSLIAQIIEKRRPFAAQIDRVEQNLQTLATVLSNVQTYRNNLKAKAADANTIATLEAIDLSGAQATLQAELEALAKIKARFSRDTLNIGVVGRARQGKSRLLQSLTELTSAEIPDGDRLHCTGVRSTIYHRDSTEPYGEVIFHTEQSFLDEVIAPYYKELQLGTPLGTPPATLQTFASQPLPALPPELVVKSTPNAQHQYLKRYRDKFSDYSPQFKQASPLRISRNQIREYVAQDNVSGEQVFFKYMAVKEVKIFCPFLNPDVKQIALVDMPGLGDTGIGDAARLVKALGQDVDAVLFVRLPKAGGDFWAEVDVQLYDIASEALDVLPIRLWSFMVLNQTDSTSKNRDNTGNCNDLRNTLAEKHIKVVECITANCAQPDQAIAMLDRVLDYLTKNITQLDKQYAESRQIELLELHRTLQTTLTAAQIALGQYDNSEQIFKQEFNKFWDDLTSGLGSLLREVRQLVGKDDPAFRAKVAEVLRKCREEAGIPTDLQTIEQGCDREGSYTEIYSAYLHKMRTDLSQHFLALDGQIQASLDTVKTKIVRRLVNQIGLKIVDPQSPQSLQMIAQQISVRLSGSNLELGFHTLANFNVSFAGIIQRQLRDYLDELIVDRQSLQPSSLLDLDDLLAIARILAPLTLENFLSQVASPTLPQLREFVQEVAAKILDPNPEQYQALQKLAPSRPSSDLNAQQVLTRLQDLHGQVVDHCETVLNTLTKEPNHIAYAMTADFVDRVLRSGKQRPKDVKEEWDSFLRDQEISTKIWSQFQQMSDRVQEKQEWYDRLKAAIKANAEPLYRFLD